MEVAVCTQSKKSTHLKFKNKRMKSNGLMKKAFINIQTFIFAGLNKKYSFPFFAAKFGDRT